MINPDYVHLTNKISFKENFGIKEGIENKILKKCSNYIHQGKKKLKKGKKLSISSVKSVENLFKKGILGESEYYFQNTVKKEMLRNKKDKGNFITYRVPDNGGLSCHECYFKKYNELEVLSDDDCVKGSKFIDNEGIN